MKSVGRGRNLETLKHAKDYSGVDGGIGVMEGSLKYDVYTVVMHRKIFSAF